MINKEAILLTENVEMVEFDDEVSLLSNNSFVLISDPTQTIQFYGFISEAIGKPSLQYFKNLFGVWLECGGEEKILQDIYESRLIPSSFPMD